MRLLRVQVPEFRALKDVDITFEKDFTPAVFPIGSQNGGGKSTLLQLIFTLLHSPLHPEREIFLKNILNGTKATQELKLLARFIILENKKEIPIEFIITKDLRQDATAENSEKIFDKGVFYSTEQKIKRLDDEIKQVKTSRDTLLNYLDRIKYYSDIDGFDERNIYSTVGEIFYDLENKKILKTSIPKWMDFSREFKLRSENNIKQYAQRVIDDLSQDISDLNLYLKQIIEDQSKLSKLPIISNSLNRENLNFISTFISSKSNTEDGALLIKCGDQEDFNLFSLRDISKKIFLASPSTQIFIFTSKESQKLLFKGDGQTKKYYSLAKSSEMELPGLFTYDFLSVDLLIEAFKTARDQDFRSAVKSGEYGNNYQSLISDLNLMLGNKKINISPDLSEITFKLLSDTGDEIDLYPENLSHGELKRLSLYMWLRSRLIEDSIVLMDEVEIAFHPDWQYQIVSDLAHWAPSNQYILATHSYELCQAVTPAHVKELEPKLLKAES
jgi:predicted ATP-binding protein involved in virulence